MPASDTLALLRRRRPLVHCLTNAVAAALTANALLALGAAPLMAEDEAEMAEVARFADALLVNLGMQAPHRMAAARLAAALAAERGTPFVLDPVAAGAIGARGALARSFLGQRPRVIKGNASEILALAGEAGRGRGTDTEDDGAAALPAARALARRCEAVVAITGPVDWITDGREDAAVRRGHPRMAQVSGMGCVAGAVVAACCAVAADPLRGATDALILLGIAGERAAEASAGPGSFVPALLDALAGLRPEETLDAGHAAGA